MKEALPMMATLKMFAFMNRSGGTGMSNWQFNERLEENVKVMVTKGWHDYETGYRFVAESADPVLTEYLSRLGHETDKRVFFSQFDLEDSGQLRQLVSRYVNVAGAVA